MLGLCLPRLAQSRAERKAAIRRRAMKRWLRARGIPYAAHEMYNETALRKKIRAALATQQQGGAE